MGYGFKASIDLSWPEKLAMLSIQIFFVGLLLALPGLVLMGLTMGLSVLGVSDTLIKVGQIASAILIAPSGTAAVGYCVSCGLGAIQKAVG